jgi:predicted nucleic acid-binding protein
MTTPRRVYIDTNVLIYFAEQHPLYGAASRALIQSAILGQLTLVTSELTIGEALVLPFRLGQAAVIKRYEELLTPRENFEVWPISREVLVGCAKLRAGQKIKTPDALHVATASASGCSHFVTQDSFTVPAPMLKLLLSQAVADLQLDQS